jgi:hypothetical protein
MLKAKGLQASLGKRCLGACVYYLWQQRNALLPSNNLEIEEAIIKQIKWILAKGSFKSLEKHLELVFR